MKKGEISNKIMLACPVQGLDDMETSVLKVKEINEIHVL